MSGVPTAGGGPGGVPGVNDSTTIPSGKFAPVTISKASGSNPGLVTGIVLTSTSGFPGEAIVVATVHVKGS